VYKYWILKRYLNTLLYFLSTQLRDVRNIISDQFSGSDKTIGPVCDCVCTLITINPNDGKVKYYLISKIIPELDYAASEFNH